MITIKAFNVVHQGRKNQNTTYNILDTYSAETPNSIIEQELIIHKPKDIQLQKNSFCKVIYRRN